MLPGYDKYEQINRLLQQCYNGLGRAGFVSLLIFLLQACSTSEKIKTWKDKSAASKSVDKILVVFITSDTINQYRKEVEENFVLAIKKTGSNAVSALDEFGRGGLASLEEEETYIQLCNRGIDALLAIAAIDNKKAGLLNKTKKNYSSVYYYNRIWTYKSIAMQIDSSGKENMPEKLLMEISLFDLPTLSPVYWAQRRDVAPSGMQTVTKDISNQVVADLLKLKIFNGHQPKPEEHKTF